MTQPARYKSVHYEIATETERKRFGISVALSDWHHSIQGGARLLWKTIHQDLIQAPPTPAQEDNYAMAMFVRLSQLVLVASIFPFDGIADCSAFLV